jgi:hypothetical protein
MPYGVYKVGNKYCVYKKEDGKRSGKSLGCHPSPDKAKRQMRAIYAHEGAKSLADLPVDDFREIGPGLLDTADRQIDLTEINQYIHELRDIFGDKDKAFNLRRALLVTSNAYKDRERQIIREVALKHYVESSWEGDQFIGNNPYLFWHAGDPIGRIIYADMEGPFLLEVAQELPDQIVNLAKSGDPPFRVSIKKVWDVLEREPDLRTSHRFGYLLGDEEDDVFDDIAKVESSTLPGRYAANPYTMTLIM